MNLFKHRGWCSIALLLPASLWAQEKGDPPPARQASTALKSISELGAEIRRLGDWNSQADLIDAHVDKLWASRQWTTDTDQFAKDLMHQLTRIPPWHFQERMKKFSGMVGDRYKLNPTQRARFESTLYRETFGMIYRHADVIARQTREIVSARVKKQPFTPANVARWIKESDPIVTDALKRVDEIGESMRSDMTDAQREMLNKDNENFRRRMEFFIEQRRSWANGEWKPDDWGLENDPIQSGRKPERNARGARPQPIPAAKAAEAANTTQQARRTTEDPRPENESTWARFVRQFIAKYALDAGQRTAIYSILAELESRASQYRQGHLEQLDAVPAVERPTSEAYAPIRDMFDELKARAEALLTNTQRAVEQP